MNKRAFSAATFSVGLFFVTSISVSATPALNNAPFTARSQDIPQHDLLVRLDGQDANQQTGASTTILEDVKRAIARYFGVSKDTITEDSHLWDDLSADPMDAFEIVAMICETHDVEPPSIELNTVRAIVDYIKRAKGRALAAGTGARKLFGHPESTPSGDKQGVFIQKIFYATTRRLEATKYFSGERAPRQKVVSYGRCEVSIPVAVHRKGRIERPSVLSFEWQEDPRKHMVLRKVQSFSWEGLASELDETFAQSSSGDVVRRNAFVFVHGFNVSFDKAARRTAQIAYDLNYDGAPIMFSWPSNGSLLAYLSDREDVEWSVPYIERFLRDLVDKARVQRLSLIAHSMGNQGLIRALHRIALKADVGIGPLFENVILAAPDFDARVFTEQIAPSVLALAKRWTLYASDKDKALDASTVLSARRLGLPLSVTEGIDTVDASDIDVTPWSVPDFHSYYASKQRVINDLIGVLNGLAPGDRDLAPRIKDRLRYWALRPL